MGSRTPRVRSAFALASTALAAAALLSACGDAADDRADAAQRVADHVLPGELTVLGARTLPPRDAGAEVLFAVADDPDAQVVLEFRGPEPTEDAVREAAAQGRAQAADLRALLGAFEGCGHPALAVRGLDEAAHGTLKVQVWTTGVVEAATVDGLSRELLGCVEDWLGARPAGAAAARSVSVSVTDPADLEEELPEPDGKVPTIARLADWSAVNVLRGPEHFDAFVPFDADGAPTGVGMRPVLPTDRQVNVDRAVAESASAWLLGRGAAHTPGRALEALARLEPGTVDRLRVYQVVCPELPAGRRCTDYRATGVVAATVDLATGRVSDHTLLEGARSGGFWNAPLEPAP